MRLTDLFYYTFRGREAASDVPEFSGNVSEIVSEDAEMHGTQKSRVILAINWILAFLGLFSFSFILFVTILRPEDDVPTIIQSTFALIVGYFGASLIAFFEENRVQRRVGRGGIDSNLQGWIPPIPRIQEVSSEAKVKTVMDEPEANIAAYRSLKADPVWLNHYLGHYVVFVGGEFIGASKDRKPLLEQGRREFPDRPRFFTKVEVDEPMIDIPSPFFVEDV